MEWELLDNYAFFPNYEDSVFSTVIDKSMSTITGVTYSGEKNSQYIVFISDRYYDGIDLSEKLINICYTLNDEAKSGGSDAPINVYRNENQIKFGWLIPPSCTASDYTITLGILIVGKEYEQDYVWKTNTTQYSIQKGFICGEGIVEPDEDWFEQFLIAMDSKKNESIIDIQEQTNTSLNIIDSKVQDSSVILDDMITQKIKDLNQYNVVQILQDGTVRLYYEEL